MKNYLKTYFFDIIFKNYFNCAGRADRKTFWLFTLNAFIVVFTVMALYFLGFSSLVISLKNNFASTTDSLSKIPLIIIILPTILSIIVPVLLVFPFLNLAIRRLHDANFSAWWLLLYLLPYIGGIIMIIFMCLPGTQGPNKYDVEPGTKKFGFGSLIIVLAFLFFISAMFLFAKFLSDSQEYEGKALLEKVGQAQIEYFEKNNNFFYTEKNTGNDTLGIDMSDSIFYNGFSCTTLSKRDKFLIDDSYDRNKHVKLIVWEKPSRGDERTGKQRYMYLIMNEDGTSTDARTSYFYKDDEKDKQ
ncbi:MAG: DUF805 domain-containing protein [Elusimicrobia bacterium]|nr:DUF805 domain-containing protein [Elusimicrobiota bacterium]